MPIDRKQVRKDPMAVLWANSHRNALTEVAKKLKVSPQFAHYVLYGQRKSKDGRVEAELRRLGAPIRS